MTTRAPRLLLWKEEAAIVSALAAAVPDGGTIVEIGTAEGGTARLMQEACAGRGVEIYTVDVAPSRIALDNLAGTGVHVVARPSEAFAGEWAAGPNRPIDFLFIDGNHDLQHVVSDWNLWVPHLKPGGRVAFHDFDPPRRGGLAHFAIRICGETILRRGLLRDPVHEFKILQGRVDDPPAATITAAECRETLSGIAAQVTAVLSDAAAPPADVDRRSPGGDGGPAFDASDARIAELDSTSLCYLLEQILERNYHGLADLASVHTEFLIWGEAIQMLHHGRTGPVFPSGLPGDTASLAELSGFIAMEQVRLILLSRLLALFVSWKP